MSRCASGAASREAPVTHDRTPSSHASDVDVIAAELLAPAAPTFEEPVMAPVMATRFRAVTAPDFRSVSAQRHLGHRRPSRTAIHLCWHDHLHTRPPHLHTHPHTHPYHPSIPYPSIQEAWEAFTEKLKRRQMRGSYQCATETLVFLQGLIGNTKFEHAQDMLDCVRAVGAELADAQPMELAIGNMVRRVLFIIREEYSNIIQAQEVDNEEPSQVRERHASQVAAMQPSLVHRLSLSPTEEFVDYTQHLKGLLPSIMTQVSA